MKIRLLALVFLIMLPSSTFAKGCGAMTRELGQLREEYRAYANSASSKPDAVTFEGLCEILDKIVELKNTMRKSGCKVPPRNPKARLEREPRPRHRQ
jgi:hypothetical protein